jgi:pentatricopeptide repeat protein
MHLALTLEATVFCFLICLETVASFTNDDNIPAVPTRTLLNGRPNSALYVSSPANNGAQERKAESLERGNHPLISLNMNLDSMAQSGAASRAQELLERIEALYQEGYYAVSPDIVSYNSVLKGWVKRNSPEKALELLQSLEQKQDNNNYNSDSSANIQANVVSYNTVIYAFSQNGMYREAEQILREMQEHGREKGIIPDTVSWNSLLYAYANSNELDAPPKAEALLREMMTDENEAHVDTTSFNTVLHAWAQSNQERAPCRAQELLEHMENLFSAGNTKVRPDVYSYTTVIQSWVSRLKDRRRRRDGKSRGSHFDKGQRGALNSNTDAAQAAKTLLKKMEKQKLQPNKVTYTSVMAALCWSGRPQEAHELLLDLLKRFEQQQEIVGESSSVCSMIVKPDTIAFSAVMDGWVKNSHNFPEASDRVMELLQIMKHWEAHGHEDMGPNSRTYTSVLSALAKSRTWEACVEAKQLLQEIPDGGATRYHYNAVLDCYAKSPRADKARHAKALLEEMTAANGAGTKVKPDLISYNSVLSACAGSFGSAELKKESLAIAMTVFKHICQSNDIDPAPYTFAVMLKVLRKLVADAETRYNLIGKTFLLCCKHGMLNAGVWQQVQRSIPNDAAGEALWKQLLGEELSRSNTRLQLSDLPDEWKCNAKFY